MNHIWTIPCMVSVQDQITHSTSLINILEQVHFAAETAPLAEGQMLLALPMHIVTIWERTDPEVQETGKGRLTLVSPLKAKLEEREYDIDLSERQRFRFTTRFSAIPFDVSGVYRIVVHNLTTTGRWRKVVEVKLPVYFGDSNEPVE